MQVLKSLSCKKISIEELLTFDKLIECVVNLVKATMSNIINKNSKY